MPAHRQTLYPDPVEDIPEDWAAQITRAYDTFGILRVASRKYRDAMRGDHKDDDGITNPAFEKKHPRDDEGRFREKLGNSRPRVRLNYNYPGNRHTPGKTARRIKRAWGKIT